MNASSDSKSLMRWLSPPQKLWRAAHDPCAANLPLYHVPVILSRKSYEKIAQNFIPKFVQLVYCIFLKRWYNNKCQEVVRRTVTHLNLSAKLERRPLDKKIKKNLLTKIKKYVIIIIQSKEKHFKKKKKNKKKVLDKQKPMCYNKNVKRNTSYR